MRLTQDEKIARYQFLRAAYDRLERRLAILDRELLELERELPDEIPGILPFDRLDFPQSSTDNT